MSDLNSINCNAVFDRKEFEDLISKAKSTTESKSILPILSNFLIDINPEKYVLKATDLENYLSMEGRLGQSQASCTICINSKKLGDIIKSLSSATFTLAMMNQDSESPYLQIQSGRSKFKLALADASEFPAFPEIEEDMTKNTIPGSLLLEGLEKTDYACAKDDSQNPSLSGVYLSFEEGTLEFAGTDGNRLTVFRKAYQDAMQNIAFTIPKKTIKILKSIINKASLIDIYYKKDSSFLIFSSSDAGWTLFSRLLEGEFPDYKIYINQERPISAKTQKKDLKDLIRRLSFSSEGNVIPVKLSFTDNMLIGETSDRDLSEGRDEIDIDYIGEPFSVDLNAKFLKEAVDYAPCENISISTDDPSNGILVHCEDEEGSYYASLIMPFG